MPFETTIAKPIFLITKTFSLYSSLSLVWAMYSFKTITGHRYSSCSHLSVIVGPYGSFGLAFLIPNAGMKVTKSSVTCMTFAVILNKFRSDGLLTLAKARLQVSSALGKYNLRVGAFPRNVAGLGPSPHPKYQSICLLVGSFLNTPLRSCFIRGAIEGLLCRLAYASDDTGMHVQSHVGIIISYL